MTARNEAEALEAWVLATAPDAVAYAASLLRDRNAAEDVVQDCYCRLLAKADIYDLPRDGRKLLFRSISNACINRTVRERPLLSLHRAEDDHPNGGVADRRAELPEDILMRRELQDAVGAGLALLPTMQRAALELKCLGHSLQEIAESLDVTPTNAGVLIHRARQTLARYLAPLLEDEAG